MLGMLERSGSEGFEFNFDNGSWIVREVFVVRQQQQQQQQREKRRVEEWLLSWWWWWCWVEEGREARKNAMGNKVSRAVGGCFTPQGEEGRFVHGMQFSESLDAGLGHSFCYVRPVLDSPPPSALSPAHPVDSGDLSPPSLDIAIDFDANTNLGSDAQSRDRGGEVVGLSLQQQVARIELEQHNIKPRVGFERPPKHVYSEKSKNVAETSFKAISGASVSANTATPRSITSQEQFNSFSNVPIECAAAFESTSSFSALPLQRVANSGPLSGPLDSRGFLSGPLERGFMSGPLERGFMSGPIERGFMSGPLEPMDRSTFSAPLTSPYPGKKRASLRQFVRSMSKPVRKAIAKTVSKTSATLVRTLVVPMKNFVMREGKEGDREDEGRSSLDSLLDLGYYSSDLETKEGANLQWAQGKAGEDRVHVVLSEEHGWLFVGIYDGFNGPDAPDFLMSNLYPAIYRGLKGLLWDYNDGFDRFTCSPISEQDSSGDRVGSGGIGRDGIQRSDEDFLSWLGHPRASRNLNPSREECKREGVSTAAESSHDGGALVKVKIEDSKSVSPAVELHLESSSHDGALIKVKTEDSKIVSPAMELPVDICQQCSSSGRLPDSAEENLAPDTEEELHGPATSSCSSQVPVCKLETKVHEGDEVLQGVLHGDEQELEGKKPEARGSEHDATLVLEQEVKLVETSSNLNEVTEQKKSIREILLEPLEICPMLEIEKDRTKESKVLSPQLQWTHGHRREQHRKYPQWRYEWERERLEEEERQRENLRQEQEVREAQKSTVDHDAILNALAQALRATEDSYLEMVDRVLHENPEVALVGSCVLVMLMKDEDVYIMNVGDSRAIIAQDRRHASFSSLSRFSHVQPQTDSPMVDEQNRIGARDTLLRQELERIIEETPTELEALESSHDATSLVPPPPGSLLLSALQLSSDHSTSIPEEVERIKAEHPDDDNAISNDRVKGSLKVTRAFGAGFLKEPKWNSGLLERFRCDFVGSDPYITCSPFLHHHCLGPQDRFLVLSSDGLYQYLSNEEVVSHVEWCLEKSPDGDPAQCLIEELLFRAAKKNGMDFHELLDIPQGDRRKYHDDVSVMVISLEGRIWRSSS